MSVLTRRRSAEPEPEVVDEAPGVTEWTRGPELATKAVSVLLGAAILCGPAALVWSVMKPAQAPVAAAQKQTDWSAGTVAGERAVDLVETWLEADRKNSGELEALAGAVTDLPEVGAEVRGGYVAQLVPQRAGAWSVTVGVDVAEPVVVEEGQEPASAWVRRYFEVPVVVGASEGRPEVAVQGLPAPVAAPEAMKAPKTGYSTTVSVTGAAGESVTAFLRAMVAGQGEIARYTSPGTEIAPVVPAPYVDVKVRRIDGTQDAADAPQDGESVHVLAAVVLGRPDGQEIPAQYTLELVARAGRWEVAGLDQAVQLKETSAAKAADEGETHA